MRSSLLSLILAALVISFQLPPVVGPFVRVVPDAHAQLIPAEWTPEWQGIWVSQHEGDCGESRSSTDTLCAGGDAAYQVLRMQELELYPGLGYCTADLVSSVSLACSCDIGVGDIDWDSCGWPQVMGWWSHSYRIEGSRSGDMATIVTTKETWLHCDDVVGGYDTLVETCLITSTMMRVDSEVECTATGAGDLPAIPANTVLHAARPNPFNPSTTLRFDLSSDFMVELSIYDLSGRFVRRLISEPMEAGSHEVVWHGRDDQGRAVASGVYLYQLRAENFVETKRMVLLK